MHVHETWEVGGPTRSAVEQSDVGPSGREHEQNIGNRNRAITK